MIAQMEESLKISAHGDTPDHMSSLFRGSFSLWEGPYLRALARAFI